ncbi:MAG: aminotransferase class V-fold PLP-dependent enzyme [Rhodobacteraceae bacterium]|nr:aminotransferase class V-fold PLP-dependent enzyme [Paracoccaceae bacterium]MCY4327072.1 aminotransferase class V-fold PLP-dependent enzyme [Paracoccaceae bacterium]
MSGQNPIFIPGPTNMPDRIRKAMDVQTTDHRSPDFVDFLAPLFADLKTVFKTRTGEIITFPASGTGGWEAAVTNTLSPGDKVLTSRFGLFSHKWIDLCRRHKLDVDVIEREWGEGAPADLLGAALAADTEHRIKAVLVTHNETATGVKSDVAAVRRAMDAARHPAMLYVDCVSSLASMDFCMDEWGVDLAVSGSQKGFMLSTGMAIVAVSQKALRAARDATCPRAFLDFHMMRDANQVGGYPYTPPLQIMMGLRESVNMLLEEGLDNVFARHHRMASGVRAAIQAWGLELAAKRPELESDTVSAIYVPEGFNSNELTNHIYNRYGVSFGVGLGEMDGKAFRIGHLGSITEVMILGGLSAVEMGMADLGYPVKPGSGVRAAQEYYRSTN